MTRIAPTTAIAEMAFHRLLFFHDSPGTPWPVNAAEHTAFSVAFKTSFALDLMRRPLDRDRVRWTDPVDYRACQDLADAARDTGVEVLRYQSARVSGVPAGVNIALLTCRAFASRKPAARQTWRLHFNAHGVHAIGDAPDQRLEFGRDAFAADPRIAALRWERQDTSIAAGRTRSEVRRHTAPSDL